MAITDSIVLITSADSANQKFGTGFVIHTHDEIDYVMTCRHVARDVEAARLQKVNINYHSYDVLDVLMNAADDPDDMAILKIQGPLGMTPLALVPSGQPQAAITIHGHYRFCRDPLDHRKLEVKGKLALKGEMYFKSRKGKMATWDLVVESHSKLKGGYSGSPVIQGRAVVAMVSHELQKGEKGVAVCVSLLKDIWPETPAHLIHAGEPGAAPRRLDYRLCNRDKHASRFGEFFMQQKWGCPPQCHFYILPGEKKDRHISLVERFQKYRIKTCVDKWLLARGMRDYATDRALLKPVPWKITPDMSKSQCNHKMREMFHQACGNFDFPDPQISLIDMFRKLGALQNQVVIFTHRIQADAWDQALVKWYITEFWQELFGCEPGDDTPLFLIFFNLFYPDNRRMKTMERFKWNRFGKKRLFKQLRHLQTGCGPKTNPLLIFEDLEGVSPKDVEDWIDLFGRPLIQDDSLELLDNLFEHPDDRVSMAVIEKTLKPIIRQVERRLAGFSTD